MLIITYTLVCANLTNNRAVIWLPTHLYIHNTFEKKFSLQKYKAVFLLNAAFPEVEVLRLFIFVHCAAEVFRYISEMIVCFKNNMVYLSH